MVSYPDVILRIHIKKNFPENFKEKLYWAQVMHSPWGGGEGASYQTPGIRQGSFVFGWFLDGNDKQLPIIMGVLGKNTLTKVEKLGVQTYAASSAYTTDGLTSTGDSDISTEKNSLLCNICTGTKFVIIYVQYMQESVDATRRSRPRTSAST